MSILEMAKNTLGACLGIFVGFYSLVIMFSLMAIVFYAVCAVIGGVFSIVAGLLS